MHESLYEEMYRMEQSHWWFTGRRAIVQHMAKTHLNLEPQTRLRVCELGCGTGGNLVPWQEGHDIIGVEPSAEARTFANRRLADKVISGTLPDGIDVEKENWDLVLMTDVLEHVEDDFASAQTALQLLDVGGILVATVPAYPWLYSPRDKHHHHFRRYSKSRYRQLFDLPGYRTELLSHYNSALFPAAASARLASKVVTKNEGEGDLRLPWNPLNRLLHTTFASERWLLPYMTLPFGLSLIAVVRRVAEAAPIAKSKAA